MKQLLCHISSSIPTKPIFFKYYKNIDIVRNFLFKLCFKKTTGDFFIRNGAKIYYPWNFSIGKNSGIGANSNIYCEGGVSIADNVLTGRELLIHSTDHYFKARDILIKDQGGNKSEVIIEDDVYIGSRVTILSGVIIGRGAVIGAGSVVTKNVQEYSIVAGVPAKIIGSRK